MHIVLSHSMKHGSVSSPSNISGETSPALWVLLDGVKPIWAGALGDRCGLGIN